MLNSHSNKPRPLTKRSSNRGKKTAFSQFNEDVGGKEVASRTGGDLNADFSSLDTSNNNTKLPDSAHQLIKKPINLNQRTVTVTDQPNNADTAKLLNTDSDSQILIAAAAATDGDGLQSSGQEERESSGSSSSE